MPDEPCERRKSESAAGTRVVKTEYHASTRTVVFRLVEVTLNGKEAPVFGSGSFEEQDLERVAAKLSELARDFALSEAETAGQVQTVDQKREEDA
jgi:flavorubredoxin